MRRKLNVKLVAIVFGGLLVFAVGAHFLHAFQLQKNAYRLLERGDKAVQDKEYDKALDSYAQYLTFVPGDVDTLQKYSEALDVRASSYSDRVELVLKMEQVLRARPNRHVLRMRLVHNLIALDRFGEAIDNLRKLQDSWSDKAEILHMLGWCHDAAKNYPLAARAFEDSIRINPKQIRSYGLLAEVQEERLHEPEAAQKTMDDLVQANPDAYQAYLLRGRFLRRRGDEKAAASDLASAYRLAPNEAEVLLEVADAARARGNWEEAARLLKDGLKRFPDNANFVRRIVHVEILSGKSDAAIENLREGIKRSPRSAELAIMLVDLLIDQKQYAEARTKIDDLIKAGMKPTLPKYLKARLLIADKDHRAAIKLLEDVREDLGPASEWNGRVNVLLGFSYRQIGEHEQELQAYRRAVRDEPTWAVASIGLGAALLSNGRLEEALQTLEPMRTAPELPPGYWILLSRARLYRQLRLPAGQRRWDELEDALKKADAGNIETPVTRAEMLVARSDFDAAKAVLEKARAEHPKAIPLWCALADLEIGQKHFSVAEQILDRAIKEQGNHLDIRLAQCRVWSASGTPDALTKLAQLGQSIPADFSIEERNRLQRELAETWIRHGKVERAEKAWRAIADDLPKDSRSRFALVDFAIQKKQFDDARRWGDELRAIEGANGSLWRYADAAILVYQANGQRGPLDEARKKLEELEKVRKDWPKVALLSATIFELQGQYPAAIQEYVRAVELGGMPTANMVRLLEVLIRRREFSKAETVLTSYEQKHGLTREIARLGADIALGLRDNRYAALAMQRAEFAVPTVRDYRDAVWLARIYQAARENAKAEKLLRESLERDGHAPDVWVAWMQFLTRTNQGGKVAAEIDKMKRVLPSARQPLALARCYEVLRQPASAAKAYEAALAAAPNDVGTLARAADFYRRADQVVLAEKYYRQLLEPGLLAPAELAVSARRHLAVLLAPRDRTQALALLEQNKQTQGETIADQRVRWFIESLTVSARPNAIGKFEDSLRLQPPTPDDRLLLARMLESADSLPSARDQLAEAIDEAPHEPYYLAPYTRLLIRTGDLNEARRQLTRLEEAEPSSARMIALRTALGNAEKP